MKPSVKHFVLIRHAHRHIIDPLEDNGLSEKGRLQSLKIKDFLLKNFVSHKAFQNEPLCLHSSPRLRCRWTLDPFAEEIGEPIEINNLLDEAAHQRVPLEKRVEKFLVWLKDQAPSLVIACSHGDWIPVFMASVGLPDLSLKKAGLSWFTFYDKAFKLKEVIQQWDLDS